MEWTIYNIYVALWVEKRHLLSFFIAVAHYDNICTKITVHPWNWTKYNKQLLLLIEWNDISFFQQTISDSIGS